MTPTIDQDANRRRFIDMGASPELLTLLMQFTEQMQHAGFPFIVSCVFRSAHDQEKLYAQGRTAPGEIVTWAKPHTSLHNRYINGMPASDAFDVCPLIDGKACYDKTGAALITWEAMGLIADRIGLQWGRGFPDGKSDWPHFQYNRPINTTRSNKR